MREGGAQAEGDDAEGRAARRDDGRGGGPAGGQAHRIPEGPRLEAGGAAAPHVRWRRDRRPRLHDQQGMRQDRGHREFSFTFLCFLDGGWERGRAMGEDGCLVSERNKILDLKPCHFL